MSDAPVISWDYGTKSRPLTQDDVDRWCRVEHILDVVMFRLDEITCPDWLRDLLIARRDADYANPSPTVAQTLVYEWIDRNNKAAPEVEQAHP